jgi:hypothetical protein
MRGSFEGHLHQTQQFPPLVIVIYFNQLKDKRETFWYDYQNNVLNKNVKEF